ncbi:sensor histidine kinase [Croceibacterium salegens]|uniref:sensor histidine kinase n=1 Tax=Croceibacterium salegens TaxID=1737568 RepID=UPI001F1947D8|nr:PAS domain-containing protein [Croceibacterium salegens]
METIDLRPWSTGPAAARANAVTGERAWLLAAYGLDSLEDDPELESIVKFAAGLCETKSSLITLVSDDSQRFIARKGISGREGPRNSSMCAEAMLVDGVMEVLDAAADERFADNPLVTSAPHVRFYAGHSLVDDDGNRLGALCVVDTETRPQGLTQLQKQGLAVLASAVIRRLHHRKEELVVASETGHREALLRGLADSMPAIVWSSDADGKFDYFNRYLEEFTGNPDCYDGENVHPDDLGPCTEKWVHSLRTGEPYEVEHRIRRRDGMYRWMMARAAPVRDEDGKIIRWFGTAVDIHDVHEISASRDLLARELSHRIKNIFAVVSGLVSLKARKSPENREFADELIGTIVALGRAHDYVRPTGTLVEDNLHGLLGELFAPYDTGSMARVRVSGDDCAISGRAATPLALVFHELATNSAKYGALAAASGHVELEVRDTGDDLRLTWSEHGGAQPKQAPAEGFGSRLVEMSVTGQLGGSWQRDFEPDGLVVEFEIPKESIAN